MADRRRDDDHELKALAVGRGGPERTTTTRTFYEVGGAVALVGRRAARRSIFAFDRGREGECVGTYSSRGKPRRRADLPDAHARRCRNRNQCLFYFIRKKLEKENPVFHTGLHREREREGKVKS